MPLSPRLFARLAESLARTSPAKAKAPPSSSSSSRRRMPLSRTALVALAALTVEYSLLSIVLHVSRQPSAHGGPPFHAASAVLLTELAKILVSTLLVFWTRELRPTMLERKKVRHARENADEVEPEPAWLSDDELVPHEVHETWVEPPSPTEAVPRKPQRSDSVRINALRVNVLAAQSKQTPGVSVIPPTPAKPPSPARYTDSTALHPTRIPFQMANVGSGLLDLSDPDAWVSLFDAVWSPGWWKLAVPSVMFMFQANAQYVASGNLSVPVFQLAYQLKIPATALCSVFLLKRSLTHQQWFSLLLLTLGVGIVQIASISPSDSAHSASDSDGPNELLGLAAVGAACLSSGFASCYFERILKAPSTSVAPPPSIWIRNIQLSLFGLAIAFPVLFWHIRGQWGVDEFDGTWWESGWWGFRSFLDEFFLGWTGVTTMVVILQVAGGLLGALVQQHADNIAKCFSTSISILISFIASVGLFGFTITSGFATGAALVLLSTWVYAAPGSVWRWKRGARSIGGGGTPILIHSKS